MSKLRTKAKVTKTQKRSVDFTATVEKFASEVERDKSILLNYLNNTHLEASWRALINAVAKRDKILKGINMGKLAEVIVTQSQSADTSLEHWVEVAKHNNKAHTDAPDFMSDGGQTFYELKTNRARLKIYNPMDIVISQDGTWNKTQTITKVVNTYVKVGLEKTMNSGSKWRWAIFPPSSKYLMGYVDAGHSTMKAFLRLQRGKSFFHFDAAKSLVFRDKSYSSLKEVEMEVSKLLTTARATSVDRKFLSLAAQAGGAGFEDKNSVKAILKDFRAFIAAVYTLRMDVNDDLVKILVLELGAIIRTPLPREGNITHFYRMLDRAFGTKDYILTYRDSKQGHFADTWQNKQVDNYYNYRYPNADY